jgi:hypothetical protein
MIFVQGCAGTGRGVDGNERPYWELWRPREGG